jgi:Polyketide cyclase / dehydrase and lipid transport
MKGCIANTMVTYAASVITSADAEHAWAAWTDVEGWNAGDHIEQASIDGPFARGAKITSKARGLPRAVASVTRVEPPQVWVDETRSAGVRMSFEHLIEPRPEGTRLTERVTITGALAALVAPLLRRRLEALFVASAETVAREAEARAGEVSAGPAA